MTVRRQRLAALGVGLGLALASVGAGAASGSSGVIHTEKFMPIRGAANANGHGRPVRSNQLSFHGGNPGVISSGDKVYLVRWGAGWSTDPSGEVALLQSFFGKVGGSSWNNSVTQYCDLIATGTVTCGSSGRHAANPTGVLGGTWLDTTNAAPAHPSQSDLAAEAARAAFHFNNTSAAVNQTVQYVILTATGNNASGAGTQYCAWHSWTSSSYGTLAYTNMPYVTDYGASCGAGFNGMSAKAGITIVEGHEFAETETDIFPSSGWVDRNGAENADKCAWITTGNQGASANVSLNGTSFPVQSLWSNAFNSNTGGCVQSYP
jgi:serine protease